MTCGIKIKVLTPEEQAMLVYQGVINSMDIPKGLIMEMGGGSTNLIYYNRRNLIHFDTLPFGAVTLTDLFKNDSSTPQERAKKIEDFIGEQLEKSPGSTLSNPIRRSSAWAARLEISAESADL